MFINKFFFKKKSKLLTFFQFKYVFNKPNKVISKEIIILDKCNCLRFPRLGICISKKNIKKSYQRNIVKRLIRESFRLLQHKLVFSDFVVIVKSESLNISSKLLSKKLESLWHSYYR